MFDESSHDTNPSPLKPTPSDGPLPFLLKMIQVGTRVCQRFTVFDRVLCNHAKMVDQCRARHPD